ncbi:MAG TPA: DinB family protein [Pyrinomonadaceae bacterium]|nr:DinB family protein [Pyrinomonadaceae bacterium]
MKQFLDSANFLETITATAEQNSADARTVTAGLSEAQLNWKPSAEQWSVAQCLDHLAVATREFDNYFVAALARGGNRVQHPPPYRPTILGGWLARHVAPEAPGKLRAPKIFKPAASSAIENSLETFLAEQEKFIDFVRRCEGVEYNKTRIRSPVTPLVRYSLADAFVITVLHAQRHLAQARRVRESLQFPQS